MWHRLNDDRISPCCFCSHWFEVEFYSMIKYINLKDLWVSITVQRYCNPLHKAFKQWIYMNQSFQLHLFCCFYLTAFPWKTATSLKSCAGILDLFLKQELISSDNFTSFTDGRLNISTLGARSWSSLNENGTLSNTRRVAVALGSTEKWLGCFVLLVIIPAICCEITSLDSQWQEILRLIFCATLFELKHFVISI